MTYCRFCQTGLKPGIQHCKQCGRLQSRLFPGLPIRLVAMTPSPFVKPVVWQDKLATTATNLYGQSNVPETPSTQKQANEGTQLLAAIVQPENLSLDKADLEAKTREDKDGKKEKEEETEEGPVATFRKRLIAFKTLSRPLQLLLVLTLAQIGIVALLLATQGVPQPQIDSGFLSPHGQHFVGPLITFIVLVLSLIVGAWFALAGALQVHWSIRWLVITLATGLMAYYPIAFLINNTEGYQGEPYATEARVRWIQLILLAFFWIWAAGISLARWHAKRKGIARLINTQQWQKWTFLLTIVPILIYCGLEIVIWLFYSRAGLQKNETTIFHSILNLQSLLLTFFLGLLFFWSSTDLLEWEEIVTKSIVTVIQSVRVTWLLASITILVAVATIVNVLRLDGGSMLLGLMVLTLPVGIMVLLIRFVRIDADWPAQIPPLAFLLGAIFLFFHWEGTEGVVSMIIPPLGLKQEIIAPLGQLINVPVILTELTIALVLVMGGRMGRPKQGIIGLFLVMITLLDLVFSIPNILSAVGLSVSLLQRTSPPLYSLQFLAAIGFLIWIIRSLIRRQSPTKSIKSMTGAFLLLAGLQTIDWLKDLAQKINLLTGHSTLLLAGFFVLAILWDFITSGEQVTNTDSIAFPRQGRMLLYMGYIFIVTSTSLYFGSLRILTTGESFQGYVSNDDVAILGLLILGSSMIVLTFVLSVGRSLQYSVAVGTISSAPKQVSRRMMLSMVGSGALTIMLVITLLVVSVVPRLIHNINLTPIMYTAKLPGPSCDTGEATWTTASSNCLPSGLQVTVDPNKLWYMNFSLSGGMNLQHYQISVQIDFSHLIDGVGGIATYSTKSRIQCMSVVSATGYWSIFKIDRNSAKCTYKGNEKKPAAQSHIYTIQVTINGTNLRFSINGVEVASISGYPSTTPYIISLALYNNGKHKESGVLSNFIYRSLP